MSFSSPCKKIIPHDNYGLTSLFFRCIVGIQLRLDVIDVLQGELIMNTINNYSVLSIPIKYLLFIEMGICIISTIIGYYLSKKIFELFRNSFDIFRNSF